MWKRMTERRMKAAERRKKTMEMRATRTGRRRGVTTIDRKTMLGRMPMGKKRRRRRRRKKAMGGGGHQQGW